jgi:osmotically-inducible protein OsmY
MLDNTKIENDVRAALRRDRRITHPELIAVSVDAIGTVVLRGAVGSVPQRHAATQDARRVDGVFEVINHLGLHPPVGGELADDQIHAAALQHLMRDSRFWADDIQVSVADGWVTLTGRVRAVSQREAATEDVAGLDGVVGVTNEIKLG